MNVKLIDSYGKAYLNKLLVDGGDVRDILLLLRENKFEMLIDYINGSYEQTPNKHYTYNVRERIHAELIAGLNFIEGIEKDD